MNFTRRSFSALSLSAAAMTVAGPVRVFADADPVAEAISAFTGGIDPAMGKIALQTPEIAENGNTVPVSFEVASAMEGDDRVESVIIIADGNPNPGVVTFNFGKYAPEASASTRIRLAQTQNVIAIARMSDGSFHMDKREVKVTIGGCGG